MTIRCSLKQRTDDTAEIQCGHDTYFLQEITTGVSRGESPPIARDDPVGVARLVDQEQRTQPRWVVTRVNDRAISQPMTETSWERLNDDQLLEAFEAWVAKQPPTA